MRRAARDPVERLRLLERLGDLLDDAGDLPGARKVYEEAVALIATPGTEHVKLLEKTLELQRGAARATKRSKRPPS